MNLSCYFSARDYMIRVRISGMKAAYNIQSVLVSVMGYIKGCHATQCTVVESNVEELYVEAVYQFYIFYSYSTTSRREILHFILQYAAVVIS